MSLSLEEARRYARPMGVLRRRRGDVPPSIEQLQDQASRLKIFGRWDMDPAQLRAAIEIAGQEGGFAGAPTGQYAQATKARRG